MRISSPCCLTAQEMLSNNKSKHTVKLKNLQTNMKTRENTEVPLDGVPFKDNNIAEVGEQRKIQFVQTIVCGSASIL